MYNMQFQQSPYSDHQNQYDISSNNDKAAFPSPITTSSLDSPPSNNNKHNNVNPYMPLPPNSPKQYNNNRMQQQYNMSSYMTAPPPNSNSFPHPITIPQSNHSTEIKTSSSPPTHQQYYSSSVPENHSMSDALVSPTSPNSTEEEIVQRK